MAWGFMAGKILIFYHGREVSLRMYEVCGIKSDPGRLGKET